MTRRIRSTRAAIVAPLALALALGLSACVTPPLVETGTGVGTGTGTETPAPGTDETPNSGETDDANPSLGASACLVGEWLVDNEHMGAFFKDMAQQGGTNPGAFSTPTGEVILHYGQGGDYSATYNSWTLKVSQDGVTVTMTRNGSDRGTYTAGDDGRMTVTETQMGSEVTIQTPMGGATSASEPNTTTATYTCDGSTLNVTHDGETFIAHRR